MDRRRRPFLNLPRWLAGSVAAFSLAGSLCAQQATPAATATPWLQASPPPGAATATPRPPKPPKPLDPPTITPAQDDVAREMIRRRQQEQRRGTPENKPAKELPRLDQLPPDERAAYQRNLPLWKQLPQDERLQLRQEVLARSKQEIDQAYQDTGLNLDRDGREVFDLRYRQERRRLERELAEKINAERTRRLSEISAQLRQEFANRPPPATAAPTISPPLAPKKAAPTATASPDASAVPGNGR